MKQIIKYVISFFLLGCLLAGVVIFPEHYMKQSDQDEMGTIHQVEQEDVVVSYSYDLPLGEKLNLLQQSSSMHVERMKVLRIQSEAALRKNQSDLLPELRSEVEKLVEAGVLPDITAYKWESCLKDAQLVAVYAQDGTRASFSYWVMEFAGDRFAFSFSIDAKTYKLYQISLSCEEVSAQAEDLIYFEESVPYQWEDDPQGKYSLSWPEEWRAMVADGYLDYFSALNVDCIFDTYMNLRMLMNYDVGEIWIAHGFSYPNDSMNGWQLDITLEEGGPPASEVEYDDQSNIVQK